MLKCLIVEDDYAFAVDTKIKAEQSGVKVHDIVSTFAEIKKVLQSEKIDLILSDVKLQNGEYAFDIFSSMENLPPIIFFSGVKDSSLYDKSRSSNPYIYLSKPFDEVTLKSAIDGALRIKKEILSETGDILNKNHQLFIRSNGQMINLKPSEIYFIKSEGNYIYIHTANKKIAIRSSIKNVLGKIDSTDFMQIHRGYAINITKVVNFNISESLVEVNSTEIPVGRKFKKEFRERLRDL